MYLVYSGIAGCVFKEGNIQNILFFILLSILNTQEARVSAMLRKHEQLS